MEIYPNTHVLKSEYLQETQLRPIANHHATVVWNSELPQQQTLPLSEKSNIRAWTIPKSKKNRWERNTVIV